MNKYQLIFSDSVTAVMLHSTRALCLLLAGFTPIAVFADDVRATEKIFQHRVVATHPHDTDAFTQGLVYLEDRLIESTGGFGTSALTLRTIADNAMQRRHALPRHQFGEGVARVDDRLIQLTWTSGVAYLYDLTLRPVGRFRYDGEGWGLTFDGQRLIMSDGSERLQFRDARSFERLGHVSVTAGGVPVHRLNELEYAHGHVYANIWHSDRIAVIDPGNGHVAGWLDLSALRSHFDKPPGWNPHEHVLNGIAFNPDTGRFYVTGKCWPLLFELEVETPPPRSAGKAAPQ
jgi:glutaminyl-peptide cyclotransferase